MAPIPNGSDAAAESTLSVKRGLECGDRHDKLILNALNKLDTEKVSTGHLDAYSKAAVIYAQIGSFQTYLAASSTLFLTLTIGAWGAILADIDLERGWKVALLGVHLAACVWLAAIVWGTARAVRARYVLFDVLGRRFFWPVLAAGHASHSPRRVGRPRVWATPGRKGQVQWLWQLLPLTGAAGSLYLLVDRVI
jgi:hypothetical protein